MAAEEIHRIEQQLDELFKLVRASADREREMAITLARIEERQAAAQEIVNREWKLLFAVGTALAAVVGLLIQFFHK